MRLHFILDQFQFVTLNKIATHSLPLNLIPYEDGEGLMPKNRTVYPSCDHGGPQHSINIMLWSTDREEKVYPMDNKEITLLT